ncbi:hypothetical protein IscW_ISCW018524, partial [Ixodes scapularis]
SRGEGVSTGLSFPPPSPTTRVVNGSRRAVTASLNQALCNLLLSSSPSANLSSPSCAARKSSRSRRERQSPQACALNQRPHRRPRPPPRRLRHELRLRRPEQPETENKYFP